jgi:hypothetical protein
MSEYKRLSFPDYFTICSRNYSKIDTDLHLAHYKMVYYRHRNHTHIAQYQVRYNANRNCIQVIFQETADKSDWLSNFEFPAKIYDKVDYKGKKIQLRVHGGWRDMFLSMRDLIREEIKMYLDAFPESYIEVFGWSLGSAIAQLAAEDIYFYFKRKPYLYTYGSVKPLFGKRTYAYFKDCCEEAYNFYDHNDIVGYMVPLCGWRAINHIMIKQDRFFIHRLFNPMKYHTEYYKNSYYDRVETMKK